MPVRFGLVFWVGQGTCYTLVPAALRDVLHACGQRPHNDVPVLERSLFAHAVEMIDLHYLQKCICVFDYCLGNEMSE